MLAKLQNVSIQRSRIIMVETDFIMVQKLVTSATELAYNDISDYEFNVSEHRYWDFPVLKLLRCIF